MSLKKLLEYQEIDIQLRRLLDVIEKSEDFKKIEHAKREFAVAKKTVEESEAQASSLLEFYNTSQKYYEDAAKKAAELEEAIKKDDGDTEALLEQLMKLRNRLGELENKVAECRARAEGVVKTYLDANERGRKLREMHNKAKERQDELVKSKEAEINALKQQLAALEPDISADDIKRYRALTEERKYPAFVEVYADGKTYSCRGCGIALSQTNSSLLTEKGSCTCESCRRIIYKK